MENNLQVEYYHPDEFSRPNSGQKIKTIGLNEDKN